jgi:MFS family permease
VGQFFGGFFCSWLADRFGRRSALLCGLIVATGGIFGEVFAKTNVEFLIGKLILGIGLGFYLTVGPLYCSEISPVVLRGISTAGVNFAIVIGQLLSNAAIKGFGGRSDSWAYRGPFSLQFIFVGRLLGVRFKKEKPHLITDIGTLVAGLPFAPESPWYYVRKNRLDDARDALQSLYGPDVNVGPKLAIIVKTVDEDMELTRTAKWVHCFQGTNLIRTMISMGVFACQHFTGIVFVLGFSTYFFELAGLSDSNAFSLGVGVTSCGVVGNLISWTVVNNFGRRKTFITGMVAMTIVLFLIGIMDVIPTSAAKWVQASLTVLYALFYQMSIGAIAFAVLGEASSASLRAKTIGLATATQSVFGTVMNVVVPYLVNPDKANLKGKVGFIFGSLSAIATIWSFFYVPELKGRTFDEIDYLFQSKVNPRTMGSYTFADQE